MARGSIKYIVVRDCLAQRLRGMSPGDQLPSETVLCAEYNVSRITIRRAVEELIRKGLLVREQGRGTFVTEPRSPRIREPLTDKVAGVCLRRSLHGRDVVTAVRGNAVVTSLVAAKELGLDTAEDLIELNRIHYIDGVPQQYCETWMEAARFPRVLAHDFTQDSLYEFLEETYSVVLTRNDLAVVVVRASPTVAESLDISEGESVLEIASTVFTEDDNPVAFGRTWLAPSSSEVLISVRDMGRMPVPRIATSLTGTTAES